MIEVAIMSVESVFDWRKYLKENQDGISEAEMASTHEQNKDYEEKDKIINTVDQFVTPEHEKSKE